jgi:hypothetical protein
VDDWAGLSNSPDESFPASFRSISQADQRETPRSTSLALSRLLQHLRRTPRVHDASWTAVQGECRIGKQEEGVATREVSAGEDACPHAHWILVVAVAVASVSHQYHQLSCNHFLFSIHQSVLLISICQLAPHPVSQ